MAAGHPPGCPCLRQITLLLPGPRPPFPMYLEGLKKLLPRGVDSALGTLGPGVYSRPREP